MTTSNSTTTYFTGPLTKEMQKQAKTYSLFDQPSPQEYQQQKKQQQQNEHEEEIWNLQKKNNSIFKKKRKPVFTFCKMETTTEFKDFNTIPKIPKQEPQLTTNQYKNQKKQQSFTENFEFNKNTTTKCNHTNGGGGSGTGNGGIGGGNLVVSGKGKTNASCKIYLKNPALMTNDSRNTYTLVNEFKVSTQNSTTTTKNSSKAIKNVLNDVLQDDQKFKKEEIDSPNTTEKKNTFMLENISSNLLIENKILQENQENQENFIKNITNQIESKNVFKEPKPISIPRRESETSGPIKTEDSFEDFSEMNLTLTENLTETMNSYDNGKEEEEEGPLINSLIESFETLTSNDLFTEFEEDMRNSFDSGASFENLLELKNVQGSILSDYQIRSISSPVSLFDTLE